MVEIILEATQAEVRCQSCNRLLRYDIAQDVHYDQIWNDHGYSTDVPFITCPSPNCSQICVVENPK